MCVYESSYLTGLVERLDTCRYLTDRLVCTAVSTTEQNLGDFILVMTIKYRASFKGEQTVPSRI